MPERLVELVNSDPRLVHCGRYVSGTILLDLGNAAYYVAILHGEVTNVRCGPLVMPTTTLTLRAPRNEWDAFWQARPLPGHHDVMALLRRRVMQVEGDLHLFMANLRYFKDLLEKLRPMASTDTNTEPVS